jgi:hypothetical protein
MANMAKPEKTQVRPGTTTVRVNLRRTLDSRSSVKKIAALTAEIENLKRLRERDAAAIAELRQRLDAGGDGVTTAQARNVLLAATLAERAARRPDGAVLAAVAENVRRSRQEAREAEAPASN